MPASFYITSIHQKYDFLWPDFLDLVSFYSTKKELLFENNLYRKNTKGDFVFLNKSLKERCKALRFEEISPLFELFKEEWKIIEKMPLANYWKLMSLEQIKKINDHPLFTIGTHGNTHANLINIPFEGATKEILQSKQFLEEICDKSICEFAFPFGLYTKQLIDYAKTLGFTKILLMDYLNKGDKKDQILKNRFGINPHISLQEQLAFLLKGSYF